MTGVLVPTASREEWLRARQQGVTASEIAVILGLSPWDSAYALYHRKSGVLPEIGDTDAMRIGRHMESLVCDMFAERHPEFWLTGTGRNLYAHPERPWQMATPDRLVTDGGHDDLTPYLAAQDEWCDAVLEAKTSASYDGWGDDGTDEIPVHYRCQVLWQMDVMGVTAGYVACLFLHSRQLRVYELAMDDQATADLELMRKEGGAFLDRYPDHNEPEPDWRPATADALKRLHPAVEDRTAYVPNTLAKRYKAACAAVKRAERRKRQAENEIRQRIGSARQAVTGWRDQPPVPVATRQVYDLAPRTIERSACTVDKLVPAKEST